jgi:cyanate permease
MMVGQFGVGFLLDRFHSPRIGIPVFAIVLAGIALLHVGASMPSLYLGAALVGAGAGSEYGILPYMITRFFGLRAFGSLYGLIYATAAIGTGIGPYAMGLTFDVSGSYSAALTLFEVVVVAIILLIWRMPTYAFQADGTPVERVPSSQRASRMTAATAH